MNMQAKFLADFIKMYNRFIYRFVFQSAVRDLAAKNGMKITFSPICPSHLCNMKSRRTLSRSGNKVHICPVLECEEKFYEESQ